MTDKEIIRELEQKLSNKRKVCDELQKTIKSQKEELKILNYTLYEERNLTTDLAKANLKISALKRDLNSVKDRFKHENQQNKEIIKAKEQECEELAKELDKTHLLMLEKQDELIKEFFNNDQLKADIEEALKQLVFIFFAISSISARTCLSFILPLKIHFSCLQSLPVLQVSS